MGEANGLGYGGSFTATFGQGLEEMEVHVQLRWLIILPLQLNTDGITSSLKSDV
jgi:hypothetical protein